METRTNAAAGKSGGGPGLVDSHIHMWDIKARHHDWLQDEPGLNRTFTPAAPELRAAGVTAAVFIEASCRESEALDEAIWVQHLSDSGQWPELAGIVAHAPLERGSGVRPLLEQFARLPRVVGVRRLLQDEPPAFLEDPLLLDGLREVAKAGFVFDACIRHHQLPALTRLLANVPDLRVVLDHLGKPPVASGSLEPWAPELSQLATLPNVTVKLSGVAPESNQHRLLGPQATPYLQVTLDAFGADRCMVGSDWPVSMSGSQDSGTSYAGWFDLVLQHLGASSHEKEGLAWRSAARTYELFQDRNGNDVGA